MTTTVFTFDSGVSYTYDTDLIEVTGGVARLKLLSNPAQTYTEDFADDTGFTYTASKSTISNTLTQDDQRPAGAVLFATWDVNKDLNWVGAGGGTTTGTLQNSATVSGGLLTVSGTTQALTYVGDSLDDNTAQVGCIRIGFRPGYSGTPGANSYIFEIKEAASNNNRMSLFHDSSGNLISHFYDSGATNFKNQSWGAWSPTSGVTYELELNYDFTTGATELFIDGVQKGTTVTNTATRADNGSPTIYIGANSSLMSGTTASYTYFIWYNAVQHTTNYSAPTAEPSSTIYATDVVSLPAFTYPGAGAIQALTAFAATTATGSPRFIVDGKYWNGSAWVSSDNTYAQANTKTDVNTNIGSLTAVSPLVVKVVTNASGTSDTVDDVIVTYTGQAYSTDTPTITTNTSFEATDITEFSASVTEDDNSDAKFVIVTEGVDKYWDGAAWSTSSEYAESNTAAEIVTNIGSLISDRSTIKFKVYLNSDGIDQASVDEISVTYDLALSDPTTPTRVLVEGFLYDHDGPKASCEIRVRPYQAGYNNDDAIFHVYDWATFDTTNADGYFFGYLYTSEAAGKQWEFKIGRQRYRFTIPDQASVNFNTLSISLISED